MFRFTAGNQLENAHHYVIISRPEHANKPMYVIPVSAQTHEESRMNADTIAHGIQANRPKDSVMVTNFKPTDNLLALIPYPTYTKYNYAPRHSLRG